MIVLFDINPRIITRRLLFFIFQKKYLLELGKVFEEIVLEESIEDLENISENRK